MSAGEIKNENRVDESVDKFYKNHQAVLDTLTPKLELKFGSWYIEIHPIVNLWADFKSGKPEYKSLITLSSNIFYVYKNNRKDLFAGGTIFANEDFNILRFYAELKNCGSLVGFVEVYNAAEPSFRLNADAMRKREERAKQSNKKKINNRKDV